MRVCALDPSRRHRLLCCLACLLTSALPARGATNSTSIFTATVATTNTIRTDTILFHGQPLLRFRTAPAQTAATVASRLQRYYDAGGSGLDFSVREAGGAVTVVAGKVPLVIVSNQEAAANQKTPRELAGVWADLLRNSFQAPWIWAPPTVVPLNEEVVLTFLTNQPGNPVITGQDSNILEVRRGSNPKEAALRGLAQGRSVVRATCGAAECSVEVSVLKRAGRIVRPPEITLFGNGVPVSQFRRVLQETLIASADIEPGAAVTWETTPPLTDLRVSATPPVVKSFQVPVEISGPYLLTTRETLTLPVEFKAFPPTKPSALWVSNEPETIRTLGMLYGQILKANQSVRFLFHHKNGLSSPCDVAVEIVNPSEESAGIAVMESSAGPSNDEIHVGHVACINYLRQRSSGSGYLLNVPGKAWCRAATFSMKPGSIVSGLWELTNCGNADLYFQCSAVPRDFGQILTGIGGFSLPGEASPHTYPETERAVEVRHEVGKGWTFITLGLDATKSADGTRSLAGNYGIMHRVNLTLANPLPDPAKVVIAFSPSGGVARATFIFDNATVQSATRNFQWIEVPTCKPPNDYVLQQLDLPPRSEQTLSFTTMPESGSNYPVRIVVRPER